jgi:hypothetical protein
MSPRKGDLSAGSIASTVPKPSLLFRNDVAVWSAGEVFW